MIKFIFFICFLPRIFSSVYHDGKFDKFYFIFFELNHFILVNINSDDNCSSTIEKTFATLVKFSPKIANSCSVRINNPWLPNIQNGFGIFLSREMDCSSTLTIDCLPESNQEPVQLTCHTSDNKIEIHCSSINLIFKRNIKIQETKKTTAVQVVALAKGNN